MILFATPVEKKLSFVVKRAINKISEDKKVYCEPFSVQLNRFIGFENLICLLICNIEMLFG